ncbi:MAG: hypothetical protein J7M40_08330 [Planctomycetes bacterium]|nr:hypothetical protein [Planctomycetota bacterium]
MVGYSRRNYMVPVPEAEDLAALNERLLQMCLSYGDHTISGRQQSVNERFEAEKAHLLSLPETPFGNLDSVCAKADKFATVRIDKNRYSVPTAYAHFKVNVVMGIDRVEIFYGNKKIAGHHRLYGNNKWALSPEHYLELIARRPQSFDSARPIRQWRSEWPSCLEALLKRFCSRQGRTKGIRDFAGVLMLYRSHSAEDIEKAVSRALTAGVSTRDAVEHLLLRSGAQSELVFPALDNWQVFDPADVSIYDRIGGGI